MHTMCTARCAVRSALPARCALLLRSVHYYCAVCCLRGAHYYVRRGVHLVELSVEEVADQWPVLQRR